MDAAPRQVEAGRFFAVATGRTGERLLDRLGLILIMALLALALLALLAYGWLALRWQSQAFLGLSYSHTLVVERPATLVRSEWPGYMAGVRPGDQIVGIAGQVFDQNPQVALRQLQDALAAYQPGDRVMLTVRRTYGPDENPLQDLRGCFRVTLSSGDSSALCTVSLRLASFPVIDLITQFGVGYVTSLLFLIVALILLRARWWLPVVRQVAALSAAIVIVLAGLFDASTTRQFSQAWLAMVVLTAAMLGVLTLTFPTELVIVRRHPWLRFALPALSVPLMFFLAQSVYPADPKAFLLPWYLAYLLLLVGAVVLLLSLFYRLRRAISPAVRNQCAIALLSVVLSLVPLLVWMLSDYLATSLNLSDVAFPFGLVSPFALLFPLGLAYALLQEHLPDGDDLLTQGLIYGIMALGLSVGYGLLVTGFSVLTATFIPANNPLLIAMVVFLLALLFAPVRNTLERRINAAYFHTRQAYQQRVTTLAQQLTTISTLGGIVDALRTQLDETLTPTHSFLFFPNPETGDYVAHGIPRPETDVRFDRKSHLAQMLAQQDQPLYLQSGQLFPPELASERARLAILNVAVLIPLRGQEELSGILMVGPRRSGERYSFDDLRFLQNLSDQTALAVERAQVIANLEQRLRELNVLGQVAQAVNFTIEFDDLLELIYAQANRVIHAPNFFIALRDPNTVELYYAFYTQDDERIAEREGVRWRMGHDLMSEIVRSGQPMRVENYGVESARRGVHPWLENPHLKAWMGVPLNAQTSTLGVMAVASTDANITYNDEQLKILWQIADQAATAIDKARLFREAQNRARQLTALNEISTQLATVFQDPDRLLELITVSAVNILEAEAGSLLMVDPRTGELEFKVVTGSEAGELLGTRLPAGTGIVGAVADRGEPVVVNDTTRDPRWFAGVDADVEFRTTTLIAVPLIASTGVIGVLEIINKRDGGIFVDEDKRLLVTFAGQAAIAIENARLFQMTDQQLAARVEELDTMQKIDRELNKTLNLRRVIDITMEWALRESRATAGVLGMIRDDPPSLEIVAHYGYPEEVVAERFNGSWSLEKGLIGRVARTSKPELVSDVRLDSDYVEMLPRAHSQIAVPLITGGKTNGVILLESDQENAFSLLDQDFVTRLAEHASPALANAGLFAQLQRANEARSEFVGFVAHELKTPMTSIKGFADLLLGGVVGPLNEQQRNFLNTIRSNVERMNTLVSDLNDVTKLQTNRMHMEKSAIAFYNVMVETLRPLQRQIEDKGQTLVVQVSEDLPLVYADQNRMIQVLTNLVSNAHKYTPFGGKITIMAEAVPNIWDSQGPSDVLHFYVRDTGIGMSEEDQARLFTPYFRSDNPLAREQPGTGLGLVIVHGIVEQHGGQIWVESKLGEGTTFHVTVPLASAMPEAHSQTRAAE